MGAEDEAEVELRAAAGLRIYRAVGESEPPIYRLLCKPSCTTWMPVGTQTFALSQGEGDVLPARPPIRVGEEGGSLSARYVSRDGMRIAGAITTLLGVLGGAVVALIPFVDEGTRNNPVSTGAAVGIGLGTALLGAVVGPVLLAQPDEAQVVLE